MNENTKNKLISTLFIGVITTVLVIIYFVAPSLAWFTDDDEFVNEGEVAEIEISLVDQNNAIITEFPVLTYNGAATHNITIKASNTNNSTIGAVVRVTVSATWEGGLPISIASTGSTFQYTYNSTAWHQKNAGDQLFNYYYYNAVLAPNQTATVITQIIFPTLPSQYNGKKLSLFASVEGLQANNAGVASWASDAPINWSPLS